MYNRREFREVKTYHREFFSVIPLRLITLLMFLSTIVLSQTNNSSYDLNDPRNPDCPCHKLQKLAEDEFKQQQLNDDLDNQLALNTNFSDKVSIKDNLNKDHGNDLLSLQQGINLENKTCRSSC